MAHWLVVGLGNPGPTYALTRHNVGYLVVDDIAAAVRENWKAPRGQRGEFAETRLTPAGWGGLGADAERVTLFKSRSFMNESGGPVKQALSHAGSDVDHLVVIHDELDLDLGRLRLKQGGGDNGHNGLKSIRGSLGSGEFYRVRCGIGRPPGRQAPADFVLSNFAKAEAAELDLMIARGADAVETLILKGLVEAQNAFNG